MAEPEFEYRVSSPNDILASAEVRAVGDGDGWEVTLSSDFRALVEKSGSVEDPAALPLTLPVFGSESAAMQSAESFVNAIADAQRELDREEYGEGADADDVTVSRCRAGFQDTSY